jgi:hypothetical protein
MMVSNRLRIALAGVSSERDPEGKFAILELNGRSQRLRMLMIRVIRCTNAAFCSGNGNLRSPSRENGGAESRGSNKIFPEWRCQGAPLSPLGLGNVQREFLRRRFVLAMNRDELRVSDLRRKSMGVMGADALSAN